MELIQFGERKSEKCERMKWGQHAKCKSEWDVYFTDSHLIWCHYARATLHFQEERRGESRETETRVCHQTPLGRLCFFGVPERCSDQAACMTMTPRRCLPYSATVQDQRFGKLPSSLTRFSQFSAWLWWETYESTLCAFSKARCVVESPSQMALCRAATAAPQMEDEEEKMAAVFERRDFRFLNLKCHMWESQNKLFTTCVSVILTIGHHVCSLYLGARMLCFCFHLLPTNTNQFVGHVKEDIEIAEQ